MVVKRCEISQRRAPARLLLQRVNSSYSARASRCAVGSSMMRSDAPREGARHGDPRPLAPRQGHRAEALAQMGVVPPGQIRNRLVQIRRAPEAFDLVTLLQQPPPVP